MKSFACWVGRSLVLSVVALSLACFASAGDEPYTTPYEVRSDASPFISLPEGKAGMDALITLNMKSGDKSRQEMTTALNQFASHLLMSNPPKNLSVVERNLIFSYTARLNQCPFCQWSHQEWASRPARMAAMEKLFPGREPRSLSKEEIERAMKESQPEVDRVSKLFVDVLNKGPEAPGLDKRMAALLRLTAVVQQGGHLVRSKHIEAAKAAGATDWDIHDTVLITAAACMFNRYVDGLASFRFRHEAPANGKQ